MRTVRSASLLGGLWLGALAWLIPAALLTLIVLTVLSALHAERRSPPLPPNPALGEFPRTILTDGGGKVVVRARPMRIVAGDAAAADVLAALVEPGRIAAVPAQVASYAGSAEFYAQQPQIARFEKYTTETLLALKPDLVLATSFHDSGASRLLEAQGAAVLTFGMYSTFDGIRGWILAVGSAVGEDARARALIADFDARLRAVDAAVAGRPRPRALSYSNFSQGYAAARDTSQDEILRRAGALNAAEEMNLSGFVPFTFEQMLKLKPDCLVLCGDEGLHSRQVRIILNTSSLAQLPAVRERRFAVVPERYYTCVSQYVVDAVELLARQLHPAAFPDGSGSQAVGAPAPRSPPP